MDIDYVKRNIYDGMIFSKVKGKSNIIRVTDEGFTYAIGSNGSKKKVLFVEVEEAIRKIERAGSINREWYKNTFPKSAKNCPCNFTSIGGVLKELGYVEYIERQYIKLDIAL